MISKFLLLFIISIKLKPGLYDGNPINETQFDMIRAMEICLWWCEIRHYATLLRAVLLSVFGRVSKVFRLFWFAFYELVYFLVYTYTLIIDVKRGSKLDFIVILQFCSGMLNKTEIKIKRNTHGKTLKITVKHIITNLHPHRLSTHPDLPYFAHRINSLANQPFCTATSYVSDSCRVTFRF